LIDRKTIFAALNAKSLGAAGLKENCGAEDTDPPAVVLPTPTLNSAALAVFKVDLGRRGRADAVLSGAIDI
jgi:hypothetical protein